MSLSDNLEEARWEAKLETKCAKIKEVFETRTDLLLRDVSLTTTADTITREADFRLQVVLTTEQLATTTETSELQEIVRVKMGTKLRTMVILTKLKTNKSGEKCITVCLIKCIQMKLKISK